MGLLVNWGQTHLPGGKPLPLKRLATSAAELAGWLSAGLLLLGPVGGQTGRPVQTSHVFVESCTDIRPVTQRVTKINHPFCIS